MHTFAYFQIVPDGHGLEARLVANVEVGVTAILRLQHDLEGQTCTQQAFLECLFRDWLRLAGQ